MFHKSKGVGQPGQWIRVCAHCEFVYLFERPCPKCEFAHYGAPMVYDGWLRSFWHLLRQKPYKDRQVWGI